MSPPCTPRKYKADGFNRHGDTKPRAHDNRVQFSRETQGMFVGPMPPKDFIDKFLVLPSNERRSLPKVDFSCVPTDSSTEKVMYEPLIEELNRCCTGFTFYVAAQDKDDHKNLRPDICMVGNSPLGHSARQKASARAAYDWKNSELPCEVKASRGDDAFDDDNLNIIDGRLTGLARSHRGQLISYYKQQASRQHRTFIFVLFIFGPWARFSRFDRAGGVVSKRFNYQAEPRLLVEFLWRYCRLGETSRGWDMTRSPASPIATSNYNRQVRKFLRRDRTAKKPVLTANPVATEPATAVATRVPRAFLEELREASSTIPNSTGDNPQDKDDKIGPAADRIMALGGETYTTHTIDVVLNGEHDPSTLVFCQPIYEPLSPFGRATRAYLAYDEARDDVLFLKDYWRPHCEDHLSEAQVFQKLFEKGVRHLPNILYAGDVVDADGAVQKTLTDTLPQAPENEEWRKSCGELRAHVHHCIVQDVLYPLSSFKNSRELVHVLMHIVEAIGDAHDFAQILHRDISASSIMITLDGEGILNDWDNSGPAPNTQPGRKVAPYRTGTWQFMSIALLLDASAVHELWHDLESASLWCLLYQALHHLAHTYGASSRFTFNLFDSVDAFDVDPNGTTLLAGGSCKMTFLNARKFKLLRFKSAPINDLIQELCHEFAYLYQRLYSTEPEDRAKCSVLLQKLGDPKYIHEKLEKAYNRDDWPEKDDWLPDQYPPETTDEQRAALELSLAQRISLYDPRKGNAVPNAAQSGTTSNTNPTDGAVQTRAHVTPANGPWPVTALQAAGGSNKNPRKYGRRVARGPHQQPKKTGSAASRVRAIPKAGSSNVAASSQTANGDNTPHGTTARKRAAEEPLDDRHPDTKLPLRRSKRLKK